MTLAAQIVTDASAVFLNTEDFAETITYYPKQGLARSISATRVSLSHYRRQRERMTEEATHHLLERNELALFVSNDATTGIPTPQLGDAIRLAGDRADERWDFVSIEETDAAGFVVAWAKHVMLRHGQSRPARY